ncbi:tryptophan 7-halogenase [Pseudoalteromonas sp. NEC-BIFX-2020_002]|nr:tryptophan 7-halogenase [Pseudoalteromonas sp. NEC-BIFX-2020_002]
MKVEQIKQVIIVGGGTAGWLTANHLAKTLNCTNPLSVQITLIESKNIPTIGVGEGTVPVMCQTLAHFGISETDFIRQCDATFKHSIKFIDWLDNPTDNKKENYFHHLFNYPNIEELDLTPYWLLNKNNTSYANSVSTQGYMCDQGLGPKNMTHREFEGMASYAYHLDAAKFSALLTDNAVNKLGVKHILTDVLDAKLNVAGDIESLQTKCAGTVSGDIFIDCTGFAAKLLGDKLKVPFIDQSHILFADTALAIQVPYQNPDDPINPYTNATAKEAGWIWDIGLSSRRGIGHVYSSNHTSDDQAEQTLRDYIGPQADDLTARKIAMQVGYRKTPWKNNCIAIGLSQGFVEPLEATGLLVFDITARMLAQNFPATRKAIPAISERFNDNITGLWQKVIDFIKLHYCISRRDDSQFWLDNRASSSISDSLQSNLALWRDTVPNKYNFTSALEGFNLENYLYVLYGMEFPTNLQPIATRFEAHQQAAFSMEQIAQAANYCQQQLIPHRELIEKIKRYGLTKI